MTTLQASQRNKKNFSMQEAYDMIQWGKPAQLKALLKNKSISSDKALRLYTSALQKILTHFTWYEKATADITRSLSMVDALVEVIPRDTTIEALNMPTRYEMSLLERVCILHDNIAKSCMPALLKAGSNPLRSNAFSNAVHRCLELGNINTLKAMKQTGALHFDLAATIHALECASSESANSLRCLVEDFGIVPSTVLANGGNILHKIAQDKNEDRALAKLDYCVELHVNDTFNNEGLLALDIAKNRGLARVASRLETYHSSFKRPVLEGVHPFLVLADALLKNSDEESIDQAHYLKRCARWGFQGENRVFNRTGFGIGSLVAKLGDVDAFSAALLEGESINSAAPEGVSLFGYIIALYMRDTHYRAHYGAMLDLVLAEELFIDWLQQDNHGTSLRRWVENAFLEQQHQYNDDNLQERILTASERAKLHKS